MIRNDAEGLIRFKKIGGGSLRWNGKIIKPGQVFLADPNLIPRNFLDVLIQVDGESITNVEQTPRSKEELSKLKVLFTIKPRGNSKTWFDVVNSEGKVLNAKALKKEAAEQLKKDLES